MANTVTWFQIPCSDFERGRRFYETILEITFENMDVTDMKMALFPTDPRSGEVGGAIVAGQGATPSGDGTVVFLNSNPDLQVILDRVEPAGGRVLMTKTKIDDQGAGYFAMIADTEGNTVGLHSQG